MVDLVTAIIKPHRLEDVKDALREVDVTGMTVMEVRGFGRQGGKTETYRGAEYVVDFLPKIRIDVLCKQEDTDRVIDAISAAAQTGRIGDGKVWAVPVDRLRRIRTGELGDEAV